MQTSIKKLNKAYQQAKAAKVGDTCTCPSCSTQFIKTNYQQAFCKSKGGTTCKDNFWNNTTPSKRNNTTRISPANARYHSEVILPNAAAERGFPDVETMLKHVDDHDGMSVEVEPCHWCKLRAEYCECED